MTYPEEVKQRLKKFIDSLSPVVGETPHSMLEDFVVAELQRFGERVVEEVKMVQSLCSHDGLPEICNCHRGLAEVPTLIKEMIQ